MQAQLLFDLRARAVHQDDLDAHRVQQRESCTSAFRQPLLHQFAAERDHEGLVTERVDVGRDGAHPVDELRVLIERFRFGLTGGGTAGRSVWEFMRGL